MVSLWIHTEEEEVEQWGREGRKMRERRHDSQRPRGEPEGNLLDTICPMRAESRRVCVSNAAARITHTYARNIKFMLRGQTCVRTSRSSPSLSSCVQKQHGPNRSMEWRSTRFTREVNLDHRSKADIQMSFILYLMFSDPSFTCIAKSLPGVLTPGSTLGLAGSTMCTMCTVQILMI